jgi:hypothetical protein
MYLSIHLHSSVILTTGKAQQCRVQTPLPSASPKTLGKESTLGKATFAECQTLGKDMTLGKESPLPSVSSWYSANY